MVKKQDFYSVSKNFPKDFDKGRDEESITQGQPDQEAKGGIFNHRNLSIKEEEQIARIDNQIKKGVFFNKMDSWCERLDYSKYDIKEKLDSPITGAEFYVAEQLFFPQSLCLMKFVLLENTLRQNLPILMNIDNEKKIFSVLSSLPGRSIFCQLERMRLDLSSRRVCLIFEHGAIDLVEASTIRATNNNKFNENELAKILLPLVSGLAQAEDNGVFHGDIKPQNIIYNPKSGKYKLTNFWIAGICNKDQKIIEVSFDELTGSPFYMSPELYQAFKKIGGRTETGKFAYDPFKNDVWSLAVTILHMMNAPIDKLSKMHKGKTKLLIDIMDTFVKKEYPNFYDIIKGMTHFYPEQRYPFTLIETQLMKIFPDNSLALSRISESSLISIYNVNKEKEEKQIEVLLKKLSEKQDIYSRLGLHEKSLELGLKIIEEKTKPAYIDKFVDELRDDYFITGVSFSNQGDFEKAIFFFEEANRLTKSKFDKGTHPELANTLMHIGILYQNNNKFLEAEESFAKALEIIELSPEEKLLKANILSNLANLYFKKQILDKAIENYKLVIRIFEDLQENVDIFQVIQIKQNMSAIHFKKGEYELAIKILGETVNQMIAEVGTTEHPDVALNVCKLALMNNYCGNTYESLALFEKGYASMTNLYGRNHAATKEVACIIFKIAQELKDIHRINFYSQFLN